LLKFKPKYPLCPAVNVQIRSYDFAVLENCGKHLHAILDRLDLDVDDAWASPSQNFQISRYQPGGGSVVDAEYTLKLYERNYQILDMPSVRVPLLLDALQAYTPAGVKVSIHHHLVDHRQIRYVPDQELLNLKKELAELQVPEEERKSKKKSVLFKSSSSYKRKTGQKLSEHFQSNT